MLLKEYTAQNTKGISALSYQLGLEAVQMGFLSEINHSNIETDSDSDVLMFAHPKLVDRLKGIADNHKIVLSTAYRTLDKQFILKQNLTSLVARVGRSDHGSGKSVDVVNYSDIISELESAGFVQSYPGNDPVHFDLSGVPDNRSNTVAAFQKLWNKNNVKQLLEDGDCGDTTLNALANSPVNGFRNALAPRNLSLLDSGKDVGQMQLSLTRLGFYRSSNDCSFGTATERALISFQLANKAPQDGIFSKQDRALLQSLDKNYLVQ